MISTRSVTTAIIVLVILSVTAPILTVNVPQATTSTYELLEPETWVGKELPVLDYIDIGDLLKEGNWLILLYHHDCPECQIAIPLYEQIASDLRGSESFLRLALVEIPPYFMDIEKKRSKCVLGRLSQSKEWFVRTPVIILVAQDEVVKIWEHSLPDVDNIIYTLASLG